MIARAEQDVGGLDVTVHEPRRVRRVQRGADLSDDPRRAAGIQRPLAPDERAQVVARDVAHREVRDAVRLARVEERDDVRVVE